jgi:PAS domain S-box-containing protein
MSAADREAAESHNSAKIASWELETHLASVAASLPGVICSYRQTATGKVNFPYASENCFEIFGLPSEELHNSADPVLNRLHPDDLLYVLATIEESARSGRVWHAEFRYIHPSKDLIWLEGQSSPVYDSGGNITWHGYVQDVTARKLDEEKLRLSEARYRAFFNSGLLGVISWSIDGAIIDANNTFLDMLGFSREDLENGKINWRQITPPEFAKADEEIVASIGASGATLPFEKEYIRADGSRVPVLIAAATLDDKRQEGVGLVLDISERKRDEARLSRLNAERLESIKSMAAGLAHEINQPLAATATYLTTVKRLLNMEPSQRKISIRETLDKAVAQVGRAGRIVARLRNLITHGEPDKIRVRLHDIIRAACRTTLPDAEERGVTVILRLQAPDDEVLADQSQMQQLFSNLIRNAREAMATSSPRVLTISTSIADSEILVEVADTGKGLSDGIKETLFEPFTTTKADGMGVGLPICLTIVEAHDGRISVKEEPCGGTAFVCTLPLAATLE